MPPLRITRTSLIGIAAVVALGLLWRAAYPDEGDPKKLRYVGWKWHLLPMDQHLALSIMTHDAHAEDLVVGMTKEQLQHRFGFVRTVDEVRPYLRDYSASARPGREVLFLNSNDYMVVMKNGRAAELVLCKG